MKIKDNSGSYLSYTLEQLDEELDILNQAKQTAITTGTGSEGVDNLIQKVTREIRRRNGERVPTEEEIEQADVAVNQFMEQMAAVPENQKHYMDSPKFDGPIGQPTVDNILQGIIEGHYQIQPEISIALDGGTVSFLAKSADGSTHELYLDRRINSETPNEFYEGAYPGREGSVQLGMNDGLVSKIEELLHSNKDAAPTDSPKIIAQQKGELLIRKIDPQYTGTFAIREIPEVGYHIWQEVRGGNSVIVGSDGGILYFNSSISPEAGIQAYKDGKRTSENDFNAVGERVATLEDAKLVAYREYMLEDENLRDLHNLIVKKEFPDGWVFGLEVKDPDQFTMPNSFLVLGKDGSTEWILPDDEPAVNDAHSVKECLELWGKRLLEEVARKHGSDEGLVHQAHEKMDEVQHTNNFGTDEHMRQKQDTPFAEEVLRPGEPVPAALGDVLDFVRKQFNEDNPFDRIEDRGFAYYISTQPREALDNPNDIAKQTIGNGPLVILKDTGKVYSFSSNPEHMFGNDGSHIGVNTAKTLEEFNTALVNLSAPVEPIAQL